MSPTLDLARDYSRFVVAFFELISASAQHIYISALPLSPRTSMIHKVYKQHARPLANVVHGLQSSWDPVVAAVYDEVFERSAVWSPCNRFIAVAKSRVVEIRDAITLNLFSTFRSPLDAQVLSFSPDSRFLTQSNRTSMVTWDLQTGGSVTTEFPEELHAKGRGFSPVYPLDGKILVKQYFDRDSENTFIATHDFSTTRTHSYSVSEGHMVSQLWTHGEFLRFATVKSGCITVWQVGFTFTYPPEAIESLPAPDEIIDREAWAAYLFLPIISRLAVDLTNTLLVWDARGSKRLLKISDSSPTGMSFSSDGHFFACVLLHRGGNGIHIWKESPPGYILHRKLTLDGPNDCPRPLLSPNGELIVLLGISITRLLHTEDPFIPTSPTLAMAQHTFALNFCPNHALAAFAGYLENAVTILDLRSGNPQLEIDTGMEVECLGMTGSTVFVASREKIVTWKLDTRNARANIHDSVRTATFDLSLYSLGNSLLPVSASSDLSRIITLSSGSTSTLLAIHDVPTGRCLVGPTSAKGALRPLSTPRVRFKVTDINGHVGVETAWLSPDGREVWGISILDTSLCGWGVNEDSETGTTRLQPLTMAACPPGALPWQSSRGYEVTHDGWILSPTQKRLLWLPHRWRSVAWYRRWGGRFLGLFHSGLPEVVILEFLD